MCEKERHLTYWYVGHDSQDTVLAKPVPPVLCVCEGERDMTWWYVWHDPQTKVLAKLAPPVLCVCARDMTRWYAWHDTQGSCCVCMRERERHMCYWYAWHDLQDTAPVKLVPPVLCLRVRERNTWPNVMCGMTHRTRRYENQYPQCCVCERERGTRDLMVCVTWLTGHGASKTSTRFWWPCACSACWRCYCCLLSVCCHVSLINASCHTCEWVLSFIWMSHVTRVHASWGMRVLWMGCGWVVGWGVSHVCMSEWVNGWMWSHMTHVWQLWMGRCGACWCCYCCRLLVCWVWMWHASHTNESSQKCE